LWRGEAYAVAVVFLFANLLGLGLGPVITGLLSDRLGGVYGPAAGLRYALMLTIPVLAPAGWFMLRAARCMRQDGANEPLPST
jgi:MFS family permease